MLIIRLQRKGAKNAPDFRLVLAEKHRAASKKVLQVFGQYNPKTKELKLSDEPGVKTRVAGGVAMSPTAKNLLINKKIITGAKAKAWRPKVSAKGGKEKSEGKPEEKPVEKKAEPVAAQPPAAEKNETADKKPEGETSEAKAPKAT